MTDALKLFPLQLIFRGIIPGGFFVLSAILASDGWSAFKGGLATTRLTELIFLAVFSGVVIYVFHRSAVYPWIEWGLNSWSGRPRLISDSTVNRLISTWTYGAKKNDKKRSVAIGHMTAWNDYVHLQYSSVLCIILGAAYGKAPDAAWDWWIAIPTILLGLSAFANDLRRLAMLDSIRARFGEKPQRTDSKTKPATNRMSPYRRFRFSFGLYARSSLLSRCTGRLDGLLEKVKRTLGN